MRYFILCLLSIGLVACLGGNKVKPVVALYDFGVADDSAQHQRILAKVEIDKISAAESLGFQQMRYRLNYENAARLYAYAESRWASPPAELLNNKLASMLQLDSKPLNCGLKLKLQVFDHVFSSKAASEGVVQLSAQLVDKKTRKILASDLVSEQAVAPTQNAEGGAKALTAASNNALQKVVAWANTQAEQNAACQ